jgi:L-asparaginase II
MPSDAIIRAAAPAAVTLRSGFVECLHHGVGAAVTVDVGTGPGRLVASLGDPGLVVLPRSALKLLHAVAFLENGLDVDDELLAIVCASHSGQPEHLAVVRRLLEHAGLGEADLRNTPDLPIDTEAAYVWRSTVGGPSRLTQNCSGNHAGMLATAVAAGWPTEGYTEPDHPVQRAIAATTARLAGAADHPTGDPAGDPAGHPAGHPSGHPSGDAAGEVVAVDGCGAPAFATTVHGLARAYAVIGGAAPGTPEARVRDAVLAHPWLVGGTGRRNTRLMRALPGVAVKDGADGVIAAGWAPARGTDASDGPGPVGIGVAVKVLDGADRGRGVLLAEGMRRAGLDVPPTTPGVTDDVLGHGRPVGAVVALPWS